MLKSHPWAWHSLGILHRAKNQILAQWVSVRINIAGKPGFLWRRHSRFDSDILVGRSLLPDRGIELFL